MATPEQRSRAARIAAHAQWAKTPHRGERTAAARRASPTSLDYWIDQIRAEGIVREEDVLAAAINAHTARMTQMSHKAAESRKAKAAGRKAA